MINTGLNQLQLLASADAVRKNMTMMRKTRNEAQSYWTQARADYTTAQTLRDAGIFYASVFFSQQAAEKAMKATIINKEGRNPKGHNLVQLANDLEAPVEIMNAAAELNAEFLSTRHPEILGSVPAQSYDMASADLHLQCAKTIMDWLKEKS